MTATTARPLTKDEHRKIMDDLTAVDMRAMILLLVSAAGGLAIAAAFARICPGRDLPDVAAPDAVKVLGYAYGHKPAAWLSALEQVRPDLLPERLRA